MTKSLSVSNRLVRVTCGDQKWLKPVAQAKMFAVTQAVRMKETATVIWPDSGTVVLVVGPDGKEIKKLCLSGLHPQIPVLAFLC